jgi:hypothetical protein
MMKAATGRRYVSALGIFMGLFMLHLPGPPGTVTGARANPIEWRRPVVLAAGRASGADIFPRRDGAGESISASDTSVAIRGSSTYRGGYPAAASTPSGDSMKTLDVAVDRRNRRIYVALPGDWDSSRDEAYLVIPGGVVAGGPGARILEISGPGAERLKDLPEVVADLAREGNDDVPPGPYRALARDVVRSPNERAPHAVRITRPGRFPLTLQAEMRRSVPRPGGGTTRVDSARITEEWELIVMQVVIESAPTTCSPTPATPRRSGSRSRGAA